MNTDTGRIYELDPKLSHEVGLSSEQAFEAARNAQAAIDLLGRPLTTDERDALHDAMKGERIVPVSAQVAHTMRLGKREAERRQRRRKASKRARKGNRG